MAILPDWKPIKKKKNQYDDDTQDNYNSFSSSSNSVSIPDWKPVYKTSDESISGKHSDMWENIPNTATNTPGKTVSNYDVGTDNLKNSPGFFAKINNWLNNSALGRFGKNFDTSNSNSNLNTITKAFERKEPNPNEPSWGDVLSNSAKSALYSSLEGFENLPRVAYKYAAGDPDNSVMDWLDNQHNYLDEKVQSYEDKLKNVDTYSSKGTVKSAIEGLGQIASVFLPGGALGKIGKVAGLGGKAVTALQMMPFAEQAGGLYANEAEKEGATTGQQLAYGLTGGVLEGLTETIPFRGMSKLIGGNAATNLINKGAGTLIGKYGKLGIEYVKNIGKEAAQEAAIDPLTGMAKKEIYKPDMKLTGEGGVLDSGQMMQDAWGGGAVATLISGLGLGKNTLSHKLASHMVKNNIQPTPENMEVMQNQLNNDIQSFGVPEFDSNEISQDESIQPQEEPITTTPVDTTTLQNTDLQPDTPVRFSEEIKHVIPKTIESGQRYKLKNLDEVTVKNNENGLITASHKSGQDIKIGINGFNNLNPEYLGSITLSDQEVPMKKENNIKDEIENSQEAEVQKLNDNIEKVKNDEIPDNIRKIPTKLVGVNPQRFQFKEDTNSKTGTGNELKGTDTFDHTKAGVITVWQDKNGKNWVVNGHHRVELANRTKTPYINAMVLKENNGITDKQAREIGALQNIGEGKGTAKDAAQVFRDGGYNLEDIKNLGLSTTDKFVKQGYNISKLNDRIWNKVVNKQIKDTQASMIGEAFPADSEKNTANQNAAMDYIQSEGYVSDQELKEVIDQIKVAPVTGQQIDMLGGSQFILKNNFKHKVKLISRVKSILGSEKSAFSNVLNKKKASLLNQKGNVLNDTANKKQLDLVNQGLALIDLGKNKVGDPINDILDQYAIKIEQGMSNVKAAEGASKEIIDLVDKGGYLDKLNSNQIEGQQSLLGGLSDEEQGQSTTSNKAQGTGAGIQEDAGKERAEETGQEKNLISSVDAPNSPPTNAQDAFNQVPNDSILNKNINTVNLSPKYKMGDKFNLKDGGNIQISHTYNNSVDGKSYIEYKRTFSNGESTKQKLELNKFKEYLDYNIMESIESTNKEGEKGDNRENGGTDDTGGKSTDVSRAKKEGTIKEGSKPDNQVNRRAGENNVGSTNLSSKRGNEGEQELHGKSRKNESSSTSSHRNSTSPIEGKPTTTANYRIIETDTKTYNPKQVYKDNIGAIKTLKQILSESREATPEEQQILAKYRGWGGLPQVFNEYTYNKEWQDQVKELKEVLTPDEYEAARQSTLTSFYTPNYVINSIYNALNKMGFDGGRILEPSMGTGKFFGLVPDSMQKSKLAGVELDTITGHIARLLYPNADVRIQGFETTQFPDNYFDTVVGNVPFGDIKFKYNKMKLNIHDYFFLKSLDKTRAGGIVAFITSKGTMDKKGKEIRGFIKSKADFLGAIRLPSTTFKNDANTEATSDIIFLKKRGIGQPYSGESFLNTGYTTDGVMINEYYLKHPEMMLGKMESVYRGTSLKSDGRNLENALNEAISKLPANIYERTQSKVREPKITESLAANAEIKDGGFGLVNGKVYQRKGPAMNEVTKNISTYKAMINIKNAVRETFRVQQNDGPENVIKNTQKVLNKLYDNFVSKYGFMTSTTNKKLFNDDPEYPLLKALEDVTGWTKTGKTQEPLKVEKAAIFTERTIEPNKNIEKADNSKDAIPVVLNERGFLDLDRISELTGKNKDDVITELEGLIYKNPATNMYETADEYLSGNVVEKLKTAEFMAKTNPEYNSNMEALKKSQPERVTAKDIDVKLGSNWIPLEYYKTFFKELYASQGEPLQVSYDSYGGTWNITANRGQINNAIEHSKYGTDSMGASEIINSILNNKQIKVMKRINENTRVLDVPATELARQKAEEIKDKFRKWIFDEDVQRRRSLEDTYNEKMNNIKLREYNGSFLNFPGKSKMINLREHQVNAVARIIQNGRALLAHAVGAGKTFTMQAAGMELRRLGLAKKPMYIIKKDMVESGQFEEEFRKLYPNAKILAATPKDFEGVKRKELMSKIATGDWDAVIVGHSSFGKIPTSKVTTEEYLKEEISDITRSILANAEENNKKQSRLVKDLEKKKKNLESKLQELLNDTSKDDTINFEDLGVDFLFVDEAHNFKNLYVYTKLSNVKGVPANVSAQKASDLYKKIKYIQKVNGGTRGVVFATGTPMSNSGVELYTMMRYLEPDLLDAAGVKSFDSWVSNFGEISAKLELDQTGSGLKMQERFREFSNVPELMKMYRMVADIKTAQQLKLPVPKLVGGKPIVIEGQISESTDDFMKNILPQRLDAIKSRRVDPTEDNYLKCYNDGINAAVDSRLLDPNSHDDPDSKLNKCVDTVFKEWKDRKTDKLTQLIFLDRGTPTSGESINLYQDIKNKLVKMGVPPNEIAFIHDAKTPSKQTELQNKVQNGEIRVLIGSTAKMGEGKNVQQKLIAIHELDIPKRPSDIEQRRGRIIRQGNTNPEVKIYSYITPETFDSYCYQMLESKQHQFSSFLNNPEGTRTLSEEDDFTLQLGEMKALATGNPDIIKYAQVEQELQRLAALEKGFREEKYRNEDQMLANEENLKWYNNEIENLNKDLDTYIKNKPGQFTIRVSAKIFDKKEEAGQELLNIIKSLKLDNKNKVIGEYAGFKLKLGVVKDMLRNSYEKLLWIEGQNTYEVNLSDSAAGMIQKIINKLDGIKKSKISYEHQVTKLEDDNKTLQQELKKEFPYKDKIDELQKEKATLMASLQIDKNSNDVVNVSESDNTSKSDNASSSKSTSYYKIPEKVMRTDNINHNGTGQTLPRKQIINNLIKELDIPSRVGRITGKGTLGAYKEKPQVIRTKLAEDVPIILHEIGHHLDKLFNLTILVKNNPTFKREMLKLGEGQSKVQKISQEKQIGEGIAEFTRLYGSGEDVTHYKFTPMFGKILDEKLIRALNIFRKQYREYQNADAGNRILSHVDFGDSRKTIKEKAQEKVNDVRNTSFDKFYTTWIDELRPLENLVKQGTSKSIQGDPFRMAWLFRGWSGKAIGAIKYGVYNYKNNKLVKVSDGLNQILEPIKAEDMDDFRKYIIGKRVMEKEGQGIRTGFDLIDAENTVKKYENNPDFVEAHKALQTYQDAILKRLVDGGLMSEEQYNKIKELNKDYVPFYRVLNNEEGAGKYTGSTFGNIKSPVRKMKGSNASIIDPIESIVKNTYYFTNLAERNLVSQSLVKFAEENEGMGKFIENVTPKFSVTKFELKEIKNSLENAGFDIENSDLEETAKIFRPIMRGNASENIITVSFNGKPKLYQLDHDIYRAVMGLDRESSLLIFRVANIATRTLRAGAVLNPEFALRNLSRDALGAFVYSKYNFIPVLDTIKGLSHVLKRDEVYQMWLNSGGAQSDFVSMDRDYLAKGVRSVLSKGKPAEILKDFLKNPLEPLRYISSLSEEATRLGHFAKGLNEEGNSREGISEAGLSTRDLTTDFQRSGTAGKNANKLIAFFNATVQGQDKMIRTFRNPKTRKAALIKSLIGITLPSLILWAMYHDNDKIKELPLWRKDLFWNIPTKNYVISIPKPFELGILFGSLPERVLDHFKDSDSKAVKSWVSDFFSNMLPGAIPAVVEPIFEWWANKSFFTGLPIENEGDKNLPAYQRYTGSTSLLAKDLGKLAANFTEGGISPKMIDNTIQGYTAGLGKYAVNAIDSILGARNEKPASTLKQIPGLRGFLNEPYSQSRVVDDFYSAKEDIDSKYEEAVKKFKAQNPDITDNDWLRALKNHITPIENPEKAVISLSDELSKLHKQQYVYDKVAQYLSDTRGKEQAIYSEDSLSAAVKQGKINQLRFQTVQYLKQFNTNIKGGITEGMINEMKVQSKARDSSTTGFGSGVSSFRSDSFGSGTSSFGTTKKKSTKKSIQPAQFGQ